MSGRGVIIVQMFRFVLVAFTAVACVSPVWAAKVQLESAEGVTGNGLFSDLRQALPEEKTPETAFEARRQLDRAETLLRDILNSRGFFDPVIEGTVRSEEDLTPVLRIDPGKRFKIGELGVHYQGDALSSEDIAAAREALELATGENAIPLSVLRDEQLLLDALRDLGYPFADSQPRTVIGDREAGTLDVTYNIVSGDRVRFGKIIYPDDITTKVTYLRRLESFEEGELYDPENLALYSARLDETRLFDIANAALSELPTGYTEDGDAIHDIVVSLTERERNTVALGVALATDTGLGLTAEFSRRNLTRRGDLFVATVNLAELEQFLDIQWRRPNEFGYGRSLVLSSRIGNEETDGFDRQAVSVGAGFEVTRSADFTYGYGVTGALIHEKDDFGERDLQLIGLYANMRLDRADSVLNPTKGWRLDGRIEPSVSFGGEESQFIRGESQLRAYFPFGNEKRLIAAGRVKVGTVWGADIDALPSTARFFAGGGGSVRGYAYQAIGPRSADNDPLGGRALLEGSAELRWRFREKLGLVAFLDGGSVSDSETPGFDDLRFGAGLGVRYDTPAGPLRVDIATPLDRTRNDDPVQIYIALGQAF